MASNGPAGGATPPPDSRGARPDPVHERRARIATRVALAKRIGYGALLVAIVAFGVAIATSFSGAAVTVAVVGLAVAFVVLPIPIVLGYGVRAAEREERGGGSFH